MLDRLLDRATPEKSETLRIAQRLGQASMVGCLGHERGLDQPVRGVTQAR
jgi:hypothetical protein